MSDPFAAAQVSPAAPASDPFTGAHDQDDPFGTSSDFRGGDFAPRPTLEALKGRLVVMVPRSLDKNAKDPNNPEKTREVYTVDLYVLNGGPLTFTYKAKGNPEAANPADREDRWVQHTVENIQPDSAYSAPGFWVPQAALIGKLKKSHADGRPFLGVVAIGATKQDRDKGKTDAQIQASVASWEAAGKPGDRPRFSWVLADPTADQRAQAVAWWGRARGDIAPITPSQA